MSFRHKDWGSAIALGDIVSSIATELIGPGSWSEIDSSSTWTVLRDTNNTMDIEIVFFAAPGSWHMEFTVGRYDDWNTIAHAWKGTAITFTCSAVVVNTAPSNEIGNLEASYDDDHFVIFYDYRGNGANFRRGIVYCGLALPYTSGDVCLTCGSTMFNDSGASPTNTVTAPSTMPLIYDISGTPTKPNYAVIGFSPLGYTPSNYQPRCTIKATKQNYRLILPILLGSTSTIPTGGENAGIRCRLQNLYLGMQYDDVAYGETLRATDNKIYEYFEQADVLTYSHITTRLLWRIQ